MNDRKKIRRLFPIKSDNSNYETNRWANSGLSEHATYALINAPGLTQFISGFFAALYGSILTDS